MPYTIKSLPVKISSPTAPKMFYVDVPPNRVYKVRVVLCAQAETTLTVLSQQRRFVLCQKPMQSGERLDLSFLAHVCDYRRRDTNLTVENCVAVGIMCGAAVVECVEAQEADARVLYIGGDSTVADQKADYPYKPSRNYCGWGQMMPLYVSPSVCVSNHAEGGANTHTWREWNFPPAWRAMQKGDFLMMQFGHNDQKNESLKAYGGYRDNLKFFIYEAREKGVEPILCTPINRIIFEADGTLNHYLDEYGEAVRDLCREEKLHCIDLLSATTRHFESLGEAEAWKYFHHSGSERDKTHTNDYGGSVVAKIAAALLERENIEGLTKGRAEK